MFNLFHRQEDQSQQNDNQPSQPQPEPAAPAGPKVEGDYAIFPLVGELDETHLEGLNQSMDPILQNSEVKKLILDCTKLVFINSKIIGFLVGLHTHLSKEARRLVVAAPSQAVMDVIQLVGLTAIVPVVTSVEEALKI